MLGFPSLGQNNPSLVPARDYENNFTNYLPAQLVHGYNAASAVGEMDEWFKSHAWKACSGLYPDGGSNPPLSAKNSKKALVRQGFFVSVGSVLQKCYINFAKEGLVRILREIFYSLRHEMHDFGCHGHE